MGDNLVINALKKITEDEFRKSFGELAGSIASKAGHIVGIYEFFVRTIEGDPLASFPSYEHLPKDDLISKWKELLSSLEFLVTNNKYRLLEIPLAKGKFVNVELVYMDAIFHTLHHRGQILSFIRAQDIGKDVVHPRDVNVDFLNYLFKEQSQLVYPIGKTPEIAV